MKSFVVFGMGRTGSTLLLTLLNSHPQIYNEGELFRLGAWSRSLQPLARIFQHYPMPYLAYRHLRMRLRTGKMVYGFNLHTKLHTKQLVDTPGFLQHVQRKGWKIIHLQRASLFDQVISELVGDQTQRYFGDNAPEPSLELTLALDKFYKFLERAAKIRSQHQQLLTTLPHLTVTYEEDLAQDTAWLATVTRICDYLELPAPTQVKSSVTKPWSRPYSEVVLNYNELQEAFSTYTERTLRTTSTL